VGDSNDRGAEATLRASRRRWRTWSFQDGVKETLVEEEKEEGSAIAYRFTVGALRRKA